jgi:hypothetical protein
MEESLFSEDDSHSTKQKEISDFYRDRQFVFVSTTARKIPNLNLNDK